MDQKENQKIPPEGLLQKWGINEVLPCPFCGNIELCFSAVNSQYSIRCIPCGVQMSHDRKDKVISYWNQRQNPLSS